MTMWTSAVEILREAMVAYAHATSGNLAAGILTVTFLARLALFPLMLRLSRAAAAHQERLKTIQPELDAVKTRFKTNPQRMAEETKAVFAREGLPMVPLAGVLGALAPAPVLLALYSAARQCAALGGRFLWIADISRPDRLLTVIVAALGVAAASLAPVPAGQNRTLMTLLPAVITMVVLTKMSAGIGLYWGLSSAVGAVQTLMTNSRTSNSQPSRGRRA